jgi:hypothetical protein
MTKASDLDKLHTQFTKVLAEGLKGETDADGNHVPPTASFLTVVGAFLYRSGTKATDDSPGMRSLNRAYENLPFKAADEAQPKASH